MKREKMMTKWMSLEKVDEMTKLLLRKRRGTTIVFVIATVKSATRNRYRET